ALESKRRAAAGKCSIDVGFWGGIVPANIRDLAPLFEAGVFGFKCVLLSDAPEFPAVSQADLQIAMPALTRIRAPLLVHAELPGSVDGLHGHPRPQLRWSGRMPWASRPSCRYARYLESRPK